MNPRHRRLLIPGLLIALLVIVLVSSLARKADGAERQPEVVSRITDDRLTESSGLVVSAADPDRAYTINDSGSRAVVYAVSISTGATIGTASIDADLDDTEALSIDPDGTLWVADTGDNKSVRDDVALYSLPEFGAGDTTEQARRYPVTFPGGPLDVEALVISPTTGEKFLISKGLFGGTVFSLPDPLIPDEPNEAVAIPGEIPGLVTDAAFTPDGRFVVARDYSEAYVLDPATWSIVTSIELPPVEQGETLAMEASGTSFLVGSEGPSSPLIRIPFDAPTPEVVESTDESAGEPPVAEGSKSPPTGNGFAGATWFWGFIVVGLLAAVSAAATTRRR